MKNNVIIGLNDYFRHPNQYHQHAIEIEVKTYNHNVIFCMISGIPLCHDASRKKLHRQCPILRVLRRFIGNDFQTSWI